MLIDERGKKQSQAQVFFLTLCLLCGGLASEKTKDCCKRLQTLEGWFAFGQVLYFSAALHILPAGRRLVQKVQNQIFQRDVHGDSCCEAQAGGSAPAGHCFSLHIFRWPVQTRELLKQLNSTTNSILKELPDMEAKRTCQYHICT